MADLYPPQRQRAALLTFAAALGSASTALRRDGSAILASTAGAGISTPARAAISCTSSRHRQGRGPTPRRRSTSPRSRRTATRRVFCCSTAFRPNRRQRRSGIYVGVTKRPDSAPRGSKASVVWRVRSQKPPAPHRPATTVAQRSLSGPILPVSPDSLTAAPRPRHSRDESPDSPESSREPGKVAPVAIFWRLLWADTIKLAAAKKAPRSNR